MDFLSSINLPHWLMIAGTILVAMGFLGLVFTRNRQAVELSLIQNQLHQVPRCRRRRQEQQMTGTRTPGTSFARPTNLVAFSTRPFADVADRPRREGANHGEAWSVEKWCGSVNTATV